jgi:hypothetical protein
MGDGARHRRLIQGGGEELGLRRHAVPAPGRAALPGAAVAGRPRRHGRARIRSNGSIRTNC